MYFKYQLPIEKKIGKELFNLAIKEAIKSNREVLYISACPY